MEFPPFIMRGISHTITIEIEARKTAQNMIEMV